MVSGVGGGGLWEAFPIFFQRESGPPFFAQKRVFDMVNLAPMKILFKKNIIWAFLCSWILVLIIFPLSFLI